jgi:hypothetical protein
MSHNDERIGAVYCSNSRAEMTAYSIISLRCASRNNSAAQIRLTYQQAAEAMDSFIKNDQTHYDKTTHSWCKNHTVCNNGTFRFAT